MACCGMTLEAQCMPPCGDAADTAWFDCTSVASCQASERRCANAAAVYLQRLANNSGDATGGGGVGSGGDLLAAPADAQLQINVLAAPRRGGGAGYLQQSVASLLYGEPASPKYLQMQQPRGTCFKAERGVPAVW